VGSIEAHVGAAASQASEALGARAYATGNAVAFAGSPDLHTAAHEAAHVIQQRAGVHLKDGFGEAGDVYERHADAVADRVVRGESAESLLDHYKGEGGSGGVQFSLISSTPVPGAGNFTINMVTRPAAAPGGVNQLDGFLQFTPQVGALNSNTIAFWQIVKLTNAGDPNTDAPVGTLSPQAAPRGALGQFGLSTADNPAAGVVGGFFTDVHHIPALHAPGTAQTPRNRFEPTPAGGTPAAGITPGPRGGVGGVFGLTPNGATPGFKRSDDPSDIRSAAMYDTPGSGGDLDFEFQSVARGEDTQVDYGSINWGFGTRRATGVINEHVNVTPGSSATFANAIERHRDFYVHEPVTIYFAFDRDNVDAAQDVKIALLAGYLGRNPAVQMTLDGFADQIGNVAYNVALSQRRVNNVRAAILGHFPATHVAANTVVPDGGHGISTAATDATSEQPADTGDQPGGVAATGADQSREANRQFNRRVTITFRHPPGTGPAAPGGVGNPAPPAPAPAGP
jgi:outer membrane protein OmpA-like peptidoglycan-associated protein